MTYYELLCYFSIFSNEEVQYHIIFKHTTCRGTYETKTELNISDLKILFKHE